MLKSILVPTDFSVESSQVMHFASGMAALGTKRAVIAHVVETSGMEGPVIARAVDKALEQLREMSQPLRDAGIDVEARVATGDPSQQIVSLVAENNVAALVCGTHGKNAITKMFSGSVSEDLATSGEVPTMLARYDLMRNAGDASELSRHFGRTLVFPTDFSSSSLRALLALGELPNDAIGTVFLVHVLDPGLEDAKRTKAEDGADFELKNLSAMLAEKGICAKCVIRTGDPKREVLRELDERRATGVVTGTRGRNGLQEAVLGSVSMTLIRQASCPVVIVP